MRVRHHGNAVNSGISCVVKRMYGKRDPFVQTVEICELCDSYKTCVVAHDSVRC